MDYNSPGSAGNDIAAAASGAGSARLGFALTAILIVPVAAFFAFAAFSPATLAVPLRQGHPTTIWFVYGVSLIAFAVILGAIYLVAGNRRTRAPAALLAVALLAASPANAATEPTGANATAISLFLLLVLATLGITYWAARRTRTARDFYAAGGNITGLQNGLAIAGDVISAGAFLGLAGLVYGAGFDGLLYAAGYSVGYPVIGLLFADRMRNLGRFTFADIVSYRLQQTPVRAFAAVSTLLIAIFYLIAQMVGAGQLIQLLFNLDYVYAECAVGGLMVCYVIFGGMMATTWVQIVKAVLMLATGGTIAVLALAAFGYDYDAMLTQAVRLHPKHDALLAPTSFALAPISTLSLGLAMFFGSSGLPHLIMRFFTVPDARTARASMAWASLFIGTFFALISVIGVAAVALVMGNPDYLDANGGLRGGGNMAAVHLAHALGGNLMLGFVSAVAFATILAVVAGLTLSGASAVVARPLCEHHQARPGRRAPGGAGVEDRDPRSRHPGGHTRDRFPHAEHRLSRRPRGRHCRQLELPRPAARHLLAWPHDLGRRAGRQRRADCLDRADGPGPCRLGEGSRQCGAPVPARPTDPCRDAARLRGRDRRIRFRPQPPRSRRPRGFPRTIRSDGWPGSRTGGGRMMKLISATPSPYARKVRITLAEKGIPFELVTEVPWNSTTATPRYNPLEKLPVLILDDGRSVYESRYILEWIEAKHPTPPMLPDDLDERLFARQVEVVADGVCDACVMLFWERHRAPEQQSAEWKARQMRKVDGGMRALAEWAGTRAYVVGDRFGLADVATGTVCRYLDVRFPDYTWRAAHKELSEYSDRIEQRPSFAATVPVPQTISDKVV